MLSASGACDWLARRHDRIEANTPTAPPERTKITKEASSPTSTANRRKLSYSTVAKDGQDDGRSKPTRIARQLGLILSGETCFSRSPLIGAGVFWEKTTLSPTYKYKRDERFVRCRWPVPGKTEGEHAASRFSSGSPAVAATSTTSA